MYRHTQPIAAANLPQAVSVATLPEGTSIFHTERSRASDYPSESNGGYVSLTNYVIQPLGTPLSDTMGLFVWTVAENRSTYYAVTTILQGSENRTDFSTGNTYGPVEETVADPLPVLVWESAGGRGRVYTQFMDFARWNPTYETAEGPTYAYNYFVGFPAAALCGETLPDSYALYLHIEGWGSRYEAEEGAHYFCGVELWCDDPRQSWYYGYSATHDYSQTEAPVTTGPIVNFTEQRLLRAVYDTLRDPLYPIDAQRIYAYGHSMGASGSLALGMRYPNVFAAVYCSEPMTNYREGSTGSDADWVGDDLVPKWGSIAANLGIENRGWYAAHLAPYDGTGVWDWQNHQAQLIARAGDEMAHISLAHGTQDTVIAWEAQGRSAYQPLYQSRRAFSGEVIAADHTWIGFAGLGPTVGEMWESGDGGPFYGSRVVRDETLPGLSYASGSLPVPPDNTGGYNMTLEWSAGWNAWDGVPVDTTGQWGVSLRTTDGSAQTVDVTPRRMQTFQVSPGSRFQWENRRVGDDSLVASGEVNADSNGLVAIAGFQVTPQGNRLRLSPVGSGPGPGTTVIPDGIWKDAPQGSAATMSFYVQSYTTGSIVVIASPDGHTAYTFLDGDLSNGVDAGDLGNLGHHLIADFSSESQGQACLTLSGLPEVNHTLYRWFAASKAESYPGIWKDVPSTESATMNFYVQTYAGSMIMISSPDGMNLMVFLDEDKSSGMDADAMGGGVHLSCPFVGTDPVSATMTYDGSNPQTFTLYRWFESPYAAE